MAERTISDVVIANWRANSSVNLRSPVSAKTLRKLEQRFGEIPEAMKAVLLSADGFSEHDGSADENGFSFWPACRMDLVATFDNGKFADFSLRAPQADRLLIFCDYLDLSWAYAVDLDSPEGTVYLIGTEDLVPQFVSSSFSEFLRLYLNDDPRIYVAGDPESEDRART